MKCKSKALIWHLKLVLAWQKQAASADDIDGMSTNSCETIITIDGHVSQSPVATENRSITIFESGKSL